jgi:hypothetical protein
MQDDRTLARVQARFWLKVRISDGCWVWTGTKVRTSDDADYYGQFWMGGKNVSAHRLSYRLLVGEIPNGLVLDHLCRNTLCVNPEHLEAVTDQVNILRGVAPPAKNATKTHCVNGHALSGANVRYRTDGARACRACERESTRRSRARQRARQEAA